MNGKAIHWHVTDRKHGTTNAVAMADEDQGEVRSPEELEANARLIAAAPDLLAALQEGETLDALRLQMRVIGERRKGGSFGIRVATDDNAIEWQALDDTAREIRYRRDAAIARATGAAA